MGYFYYQDSLGNTSHVTDSVGNLPERYTYDALIVLAFICCSGLVGCATGPERSRPNKKIYPEDTPEQVSLTPAEVKAAITPANAFYLSARQRRLCAKRAAEGDYGAARKLAWFYATNHEGRERTHRDDERYEYWKRVASRLYDAGQKAKQGK